MTLASTGVIVAALKAMARRLGAIFGIAVMLGLVSLLIFEVYQHHQAGRELEEPAVVALDARHV
jgi:nitrate reductase gamma subunit